MAWDVLPAAMFCLLIPVQMCSGVLPNILEGAGEILGLLVFCQTFWEGLEGQYRMWCAASRYRQHSSTRAEASSPPRPTTSTIGEQKWDLAGNCLTFASKIIVKHLDLLNEDA